MIWADSYSFLRREWRVTPAGARKIQQIAREDRREQRRVRKRQRRLDWQRRMQARRRHLVQRRGWRA